MEKLTFDLETKLENDSDASLKQQISEHLSQKLVAVKTAMQKGASREIYHEWDAASKALQAAIDVIDAVDTLRRYKGN